MEDEYHALIAIPIVRPDLRLNLFTESELAAAELLVQLSESASGSRDRDQSSSSTTSSPRSVNTLLKLNPVAMGVDDCNSEDGMAAAVLPTRRKRYRTLADVYESTACIGGDAEKEQNDEKRRKRKRKRRKTGRGMAMAMAML